MYARHRRLSAGWLTALLGLAVFCPAFAQEPQEPLHVQVDRLIAAGWQDRVPQAAGLSSDSEFVRRAYLDLVGMIPPHDEAAAFLRDEDPDKRRKLIDRLVASPGFARRMMYFYDEMFLERREQNRVPKEDWLRWLYERALENTPYDELVRQLLAADGTAADTRPAAKFLLDRDVDTLILVRDVGRIFLGMDLQCAQCHDHPLIDDYKQSHYFGLYSYLHRSYLFEDKKAKRHLVGEKAAAEVTYKSVFYPEDTHKAGPHVLDGPVVEEPAFPQGGEYYAAPDKNNTVRGVPKYSIRRRLAEDLTRPDQPAFARNIVNRLWAMLMGRGLVHPVDLHHADNPPSHPELLELLARQFVESGFDVRGLVRELALSQTYQRSSELPTGVTPEQLPEDRFAVALLRPLTPDQFAWSLLVAGGHVARQRQAAQSAIDGDPRLRELLSLDEKRQFDMQRRVEVAGYEALRGNIGQFVNTFAGPAGEVPEAFEATAFQALFLSNGPVVNNWVKATVASLGSALADPAVLADELYLRALSRYPEPEERQRVADLVLARPEDQRPAAAEEMYWGLLTSAEFRLNH